MAIKSFPLCWRQFARRARRSRTPSISTSRAPSPARSRRRSPSAAGPGSGLLLDGFGTLQMPAEYRETMTRAGCQLATFRPLSPLSLVAVFGFGRANKRNHRRILVVDGRIGFTGGSGVGPKWMGDGRTKDQWSHRSRAPSSRTGSTRPATCSAASRTSRARPGPAQSPPRSSGAPRRAGASRCTRCSSWPSPRRDDRSTSPIRTSFPTPDDPGAHRRARPRRAGRRAVARRDRQQDRSPGESVQFRRAAQGGHRDL